MRVSFIYNIGFGSRKSMYVDDPAASLARIHELGYSNTLLGSGTLTLLVGSSGRYIIDSNGWEFSLYGSSCNWQYSFYCAKGVSSGTICFPVHLYFKMMM